MRLAIEHDVLVDFVGQQIRRRIAQYFRELPEIRCGQYRPGRVVRKVDDDEPGPVAQCISEPLPVDRKVETIVADCQRHVNGAPAGERYRGFVRVIGGIEYDHFVAAADDRLDCAEQAFGCARADGDLGFGVQRALLQVLDLAGNCATQRRHARHRRVLVGAAPQVVVDAVDQFGGRFEAWKTLRQVDGFAVLCQLAHDREDRGADVRQLAGERAVHTRATMTPSQRDCQTPACKARRVE